MLASKQSTSSVSLDGKITSVLGIGNAKNLKKLAKIFRTFKFSSMLVKKATVLNMNLNLLSTEKRIRESLLDPDWRNSPIQMGVPANSQIIGQIAFSAGIEAIAFPSKNLSGNNLAIFPRNFENSDFYVRLTDEAPKGTIDSLDRDTWRELISV